MVEVKRTLFATLMAIGLFVMVEPYLNMIANTNAIRVILAIGFALGLAFHRTIIKS